MEILSSRTIIRPTDLERSLAFYRDGLGLAIARQFGSGTGRGVVFFTGGGLLEVVGQRPPSGDPADSGLALWLQVRDMQATVADLGARGLAITRGPQLEPWGLVEAWVDDPDGLRIILVEVPADHPLRRDTRSS
jgi:catechol 2,3-dioxygenase-like lactoylglutathione lyase family enzyme